MIRTLPLVIVLLLAACEKVSFKDPQPRGRKALASVPRQLQGKYLLVDDHSLPSKDTLIILENGFRIGFYDPDERDAESNGDYASGILGDSLILKSYKGYYFVNFNEKPEWDLRVLKKDNEGNLKFLSPEMEGVRFADYLKKLNEEIKVILCG